MLELSGTAIADFLYRDLICRFGYFTKLKTDNGKEYVNEVVDQLLYHYGITHIKSIEHHPQGNPLIIYHFAFLE